jgi:hypothetical protein
MRGSQEGSYPILELLDLGTQAEPAAPQDLRDGKQILLINPGAK